MPSCSRAVKTACLIDVCDLGIMGEGNSNPVSCRLCQSLYEFESLLVLYSNLVRWWLFPIYGWKSWVREIRKFAQVLFGSTAFFSSSPECGPWAQPCGTGGAPGQERSATCRAARAFPVWCRPSCNASLVTGRCLISAKDCESVCHLHSWLILRRMWFHQILVKTGNFGFLSLEVGRQLFSRILRFRVSRWGDRWFFFLPCLVHHSCIFFFLNSKGLCKIGKPYSVSTLTDCIENDRCLNKNFGFKIAKRFEHCLLLDENRDTGRCSVSISSH